MKRRSFIQGLIGAVVGTKVVSALDDVSVLNVESLTPKNKQLYPLGTRKNGMVYVKNVGTEVISTDSHVAYACTSSYPCTGSIEGLM